MTMLRRVVTGIAGGVLGAGAMAALQFPLRAWLRRTSTPGVLADSGIGFQAAFRLPEPTVVTAQRLFFGNDFPVEHPLASALTVHAGFGASAGLFYACCVPDGVLPALAFAVALWLGATEGVLPMLALTKTPRRSSVAIQAFGLGEHILYACLLYRVRRGWDEAARRALR
jgi:hypothetical protein